MCCTIRDWPSLCYCINLSINLSINQYRDRTSQIVSIAQVLIDPFYRTIEGIATLIEKDWCAFGHKFDDRCGHGFDHSHHSEERSPIFLQFLDVLHQILRQFPIVFEYTDDVLVFLVNHSSSCLFGNFLGSMLLHTVSEWLYYSSLYYSITMTMIINSEHSRYLISFSIFLSINLSISTVCF